MHHHAHSFGWQHKTCNSIGNLISNDASLSSDNTLQLRKRTTTDAADVYLHSWRFACACHGPPLCSCTQPSGTRPSPLNHFLWCCLHAIGCSKTPISLGHGLRQPMAMDSLILAHAMPWIPSSLHTQCHGFTHPCTHNAMDSLILAHAMPWILSSLHTQCHGFPHPCTHNAMDSLILAHAMSWIPSSLHTQCLATLLYTWRAARPSCPQHSTSMDPASHLHRASITPTPSSCMPRLVPPLGCSARPNTKAGPPAVAC